MSTIIEASHEVTAVNVGAAPSDNGVYVVSSVPVAGRSSPVESMQVIKAVEVPNTLYGPLDIANAHGINIDRIGGLAGRIRVWKRIESTKGPDEREHRLRTEVVPHIKGDDMNVLMGLRLYGECNGQLPYAECYEQAPYVSDLADTIRNGARTMGADMWKGLTLLCGDLSTLSDEDLGIKPEPAKSPPAKTKSKLKPKRRKNLKHLMDRSNWDPMLNIKN